MTTTELLAGRYELGDPVGRGRSTVYRAYDKRLRRRVAVKEVKLVAGAEEVDRVRSRVVREAQAAARLDTPTVVTVYDVVEEHGSIWLVMELVEAPNLAGVVADHGPLDHGRAAAIGLGVLEALESAHGAGIVHRDVKPANVLVRAGDRVTLTDFGVASVRDESRLTATGLVIGSPSYMAPEQARGDAVGPATDLWALGALLYFAVEGRPPFDAGSPVTTASAVVNGEPRPQLRPGPLDRIIGRLLMKDPALRPDAGSVRAALQGLAAPVPLADEPTRVIAAPPGRRGARRPGAVAAAAALVIVAAVAAWALSDGGTTADPEAQDAPEAPGTEAPGTEAPGTETPGTETPGTAATTTTIAGTTTTAASAVPDGWTLYRDTSGYSIAHPAEWRVQPASGPRIDFRDPGSGAYLRVDWTDQPKEDPVADWREQSQGFAARHDGYEEIRLEPYEYRDFDAAIWEFRFTDGGRRLRVANINLITGPRAYALYFQTPDGDWDTSQDTFAWFRDTFTPAE